MHVYDALNSSGRTVPTGKNHSSKNGRQDPSDSDKNDRQERTNINKQYEARKYVWWTVRWAWAEENAFASEGLQELKRAPSLRA
jgi:hypothetical protein